MKPFRIEGIRHSAVVIANDGEEAIKLATEAHNSNDDEKNHDPRVLYGSVGDWEIPTAFELMLPRGYQIVSGKK